MPTHRLLILVSLLALPSPGMHAQARPAPAPPGLSVSPAPPATVSADNVLSFRSLLAGETPEWAPDGSGIMFQSGLGGGPGLWSRNRHCSAGEQLEC